MSSLITQIEADAQRVRATARVTVLGAVVNVALTAIKGFAGIVGGSSVMVADAVHSLSDLVSDAVAYFSVRAAAKPPDEDHPYGHGRFETLGTLGMATLLLVAAGGIAFDAYQRFGRAQSPESIALWAALVSIVVKEGLYRVTAAVGRTHRSPVVTANAWHHRADALSSVAALVGIVGARAGYPVLDPIAAIVVAVMIGATAVQFFRVAGHELTERIIQEDMLEQLDTGIRGLPGVVNLHELRARRLGPNVLVDLHVEVEGSTTVSDGHQVAERVRKFVIEQRPDVSEVLVHVDPEPDDESGDSALGRPRETIEHDVRAVAAVVDGVEVLTHVIVHFLRRRIDVQVHIAVDPDLQVREAAVIASALQAQLELIDDIDSADVHLELDPDHHAEALSVPPVTED